MGEREVESSEMPEKTLVEDCRRSDEVLLKDGRPVEKVLMEDCGSVACCVSEVSEELSSAS